MILPVATQAPCLHDRYEEAGTTESEYFWQDLLVARMIHDAEPQKHVDIGSRVDGFVAHVAPSLVARSPFGSNVHMAPHHFCTGFSKYWYQHHLEQRGFLRLRPLLPMATGIRS